MNGILTFQSGYPLLHDAGLEQRQPVQPGAASDLDGQRRDAERSDRAAEAILKWFDTSQFSTTPAFTFGNAPRVMPNLRSDGVKNLDFSLFKNNRFRNDRWNAQIRIEAFNVLNRTQFNAPNRQVDAGDFGTISGARRGASGADRREVHVLRRSAARGRLPPVHRRRIGRRRARLTRGASVAVERGHVGERATVVLEPAEHVAGDTQMERANVRQRTMTACGNP